ncbi:putative NBD/HSP70 family sugar kinase [Actinoplanes lutulentus]|uniref:Transcriptional regulator n=1 Tax=Actinoplanes lutulentus TaxID=1287878 RepID=A0A327YYE8_9ACTN|nr:ROK family transcriptional regulator [Actinoplanes lutulentus]MBB2946612.1 putative NBD/HSP70 family sugar kinase [Actinoplanes lutulentus]RAK26530.1 transcriptional regulator [Actinoplanes lutulentus]
MSRLAGSSKLLRAMNESAALELLLDPGMLTRADLRRITALSTPTISELLRRLTAAGLITVVGHDSGRPGPAAEIYAADPDAAYTVAVSIRETGTSGNPSVAAALCDLTGTIRATVETHVDFLGADPVSTVAGVVTRLRKRAGVEAGRIRHVQLGVPGSYDPRSETIRLTDVPGFGRPGLVPRIAEALGTRVGADNDVNLAAVAERRRGAGREAENFALLWIGQDGLGLAIDINGTLLRGTRGGAGEIGYVPLYSPDSPHRKIDLQDLFGGPAIMELARDHGIAGETPAAVVAAGSEEFLAVLADRVVVGLAAVTAILDPYLIVLAGPIAQAGGEALLTAVTSAFGRAAPLECSITVTAIEGDAVLLGALDAGLKAVREVLVAAIRAG